MPLTGKDPDIFLRSTPTIDFDNKAVKKFVAENSLANSGETDRAISLYYAVRDRIRYDPYTFSPDMNDYSACCFEPDHDQHPYRAGLNGP